MRTCDKCGCYLPDGWEECPACGLMTYESKPEEMTGLEASLQMLSRIKPFYGNATVEECSRKAEDFEIVDVNTADGRTTHFLVPKPWNKSITELSHELRLAGMGYGVSTDGPIGTRTLSFTISRPALLGTERSH